MVDPVRVRCPVGGKSFFGQPGLGVADAAKLAKSKAAQREAKCIENRSVSVCTVFRPFLH